jgi:hypothetical protein
MLGVSLGLMDTLGFSDGIMEGTLLGAFDGTIEGTLLGLPEGAADGLAEGAADGLADGAAEGDADGAGDGAAVGIPHMHGSSGATAAAVWISRHSWLVNSDARPRESNSPHWTPPMATVSKVGSPLKQTVQKTVSSVTVGADVPTAAGEVAGDMVGSLGHPHVPIAKAWAIAHCSMV